MNPLVLYHYGCNDGFCSAWIAKKALPNAECVGAVQGGTPPDVFNRDVFLLDFAFDRKTVLEMESRAKSITVIDHHVTNEKQLKDLPYCHFDVSKSAARLTWEYFFPDKKTPSIVLYVEDRDLWNNALENTKAINANLLSHKHNFEIWDQLEKDIHSTEFLSQGEALLRYQRSQMFEIASHARKVYFEGYRILAVNTCVCFSDVAGFLAEDKPFGLAWYLREDGKYKYSLRSRENGINVATIAEKYKGGGHFHSAGFSHYRMLLGD